MFLGAFVVDLGCVLADTHGGLSLLGWAVAIAILLIVIDFFIQSDMPSIAAYLLLGYVAASYIPMHNVYRLLLGILIAAVLVWAHYALWKNIVSSLVNERLSPDRYVAGAGGVIDKKGIVREVGDVQMVEIEGDLWPIERGDPVGVGEAVVVIEVCDGVLRVQREA